MTLFSRSCHGPNLPYPVLAPCLVHYVTPDVTAGSTSGVKINLGQSSCYFDQRSNFQLDLPRSKSIWFDASWREKHDGAHMKPLSFLVPKVFAKNGTSQICDFFTLNRPGGVKIWPKEVRLGTVGLRTSQGFVYSLSHRSISIRGEMEWEWQAPCAC